jgi:prepilin-type N-terminal cleavage/methylation domain-containing protein
MGFQGSLPIMKRIKKDRRVSAFTLVELLVVIAIIGVLVALLLPAIQAAREAARRSQCQNNLKQIGLGILNYESSKKHFPPGQFKPIGLSKAEALGWSVWQLPYIEQQAIFDRFDFTFNVAAHPNNRLDLSGPSNAVISTYLCPSTGRIQMYRGNDGRLNGLPEATSPTDLSGNGMGCIDYIGIPGPDMGIINRNSGIAYDREIGSFLPYEPGRGMLMRLESNPNRCFNNTTVDCSAPIVKFAEITDGSANTIIVAESTGRGTEEGLECSGENIPLTTEYSGAWASLKSISRVKLDPDPTIGRAQCNGERVSAINPPAKYQFAYEEFFSDHPGVVLTLRCDGSVQPLTDETNRDVYFALITRDGGEIFAEN